MQGTAAVLRRLSNIQTCIEGMPNEIAEFSRIAIAAPAQAAYSTAAYDGTNDVTVRVEPTEKGCDIIASGSALLFIEYGTGYHYAHDNPIQDPRNDPGSWSLGPQGKGFLGGKKFLKYKGFWPMPGLGKGMSWVDGNPSANVFYEAGKSVEQDIPKHAQTLLDRAFK